MAPATDDRLSLLPESLITVILSLLPIKDAVRTSALSHHWRHSWRSRPNIEINDAHFPSLPHCLHFALQWLIHYPNYPSTIDSFSLTLSPPLPDNQHTLLNTLIHFALTRDTKSLSLNLSHDFHLPEFVYEYDGLDELTLFSCSFSVSEFVNLSWLKTASFGCMAFQNDELRQLLMGCPLLESLSLYKCVEATEYLVVSTRLGNLVVDCCEDLCDLCLVTPNLKRFKYVGALIGFGVVDLGVIEEADLDLGLESYYDEESGDSVQKLIMNFHRARVLRVCSYITQVLAMASNPWKLPGLIEAKHLILKSALHPYEYVGIACLLTGCHSLRKVQFDIAQREIFEDDDDHPCSELDPETFWGEDFQAPSSIMYRLYDVEINGFGGSDNEFRVLKFLFKSGFVLRMIRLRVARDDEGTWMQLCRDLSRILRSWRCKSIYQLNILIE